MTIPDATSPILDTVIQRTLTPKFLTVVLCNLEMVVLFVYFYDTWCEILMQL